MKMSAQQALPCFGLLLAAAQKVIDAAGNLIAQVPEGWRPIDTAPKELGKRILGLKDCGEGTLTSISIVFRLNDGEWHLDGCAPSTAEGLGYRVTHWMPLPAAPEVKK